MALKRTPLVVRLGDKEQGRFAFCGPYEEVLLCGAELRGRVDARHTELIARWDGHTNQWIDGHGVIQRELFVSGFYR